MFNYPQQLKLQQSQIMGEASPYAHEEEESDMEISDDDVEISEKKTTK